jgi:hypothetical protein
MTTPYYVQSASLQGPGSQHKVNFTNMSSQQLNPGTLVNFFVKADSERQPMPYTDGDIPTDRTGVAKLVSEWNNVSNLPRGNELPSFFHKETPYTKDTYYRTPEQRTWGVPDHLLEARATELY